MAYADLELSLRRWSGDDYAVELRFQLADAGAEAHLISGAPPRVRIDFEALEDLQDDSRAYGDALSRMLMADARIPEALAQARRAAEQANAPLRLRLRLDADDDEIHTLRWETLHDPAKGGFFFASERVLLSRYLDSADMTPLAARPRTDLKAVVLVANPDGLEDYKLAPVDVAGEVARSQAALEGIATTVIARAISGQVASLSNLAAALRDGPDILYLVAHGTLRRGRPFVWLEDEQGGVGRLEGEELIEAIERLARRPLLVVLASCQSAGAGQDQGALAALGPRLASAGIAATVAMQGNVTMATVERYMPIFFKELRRDGQIDRALAAARAAVLDRPDWWMPVLFLRVRNGMLWTEPESAKPAADIPPPPMPERPPEVPGFVGRDAELAVFEARLASQHMAVITGMPGVGKTSLAALLARKVAATNQIFWHSFKAGEGIDTVIWELAGFLAHNDQAGLWEMLQSARQSGGQPPPIKVLFDYLLEMLRGKGYLLCFDDFSFVDQDPQLEQFVERLRPELRSGGIRLVLTSRRIPDFIQEDAVEELAGLGVEDVRRLLDARSVGIADDLIVDLYSQTGGNAQLLTLAADALGRAGDPARVIGHLTETDNIERYLLKEVDAGLSDDERQVMQVIAVLLDYGGTRGAIEALLEGASARRTLRVLTDRYLLIAHDGPDGKEYRQHAIVQPFYYGELGKRERVRLHQVAGAYYETEERDVLRAAIHYDRAGDYARAADLATADVWALINAGQARVLRQLLERFLVRQSDPDMSRRLDPERWAIVQVALGRTYFQVGELKLARQTYEQAFAYLSSLVESRMLMGLAATICTDMGELLQPESPQAAREWLERGLSVVTGSELLVHAAALHIRLGTVLTALGDYPAALSAVQRGVALLPETSSHWHVSVFINLGIIAYYQGDLDQAVAHTQHALEIARRLRDYYRLITILGNLGTFTYVNGDWKAALAYTNEAVELAEHVGNVIERVRLEMNLGLISINRGDDAGAQTYLTNSLTLSRTKHLLEWAVPCLSGLADLHLRNGEALSASPLLAEAEQLAREAELSYRQPEIRRLWAEVHLARMEWQSALEDIERALVLARDLGDPYDEGLSLRVKGRALRATGQSEAALEAFERSLELLADDPYESARTQVQLGLALRVGNMQRANTLLVEARATFARLGAERDLAEVDALLVQ